MLLAISFKDAAYLHDIGKIVLDHHILNNNYRLDDKEFNKMQKHATAGYRILHSFDKTMDIAEIVLYHHERWDGKGYPKGIKGEEIPRLARMIALAESYDRMTNSSQNTKKMTARQALDEIRKNAGTQFDPEIAQIFARLIEEKPDGKHHDGG